MEIHQLQGLVTFSKAEPARVLLSTGAHSRVTLWCLEPGQEIHPHSHAGDHVWVVQEGDGWYLAADGERAVSAGAMVFAPAGEVHGMRARGRLVFVSVSAG